MNQGSAELAASLASLSPGTRSFLGLTSPQDCASQAALLASVLSPEGRASLLDLRGISEPFFVALSKLLVSRTVTLEQVLDLDYVGLLEIVSQAPPDQQLPLLESTLRSAVSASPSPSPPPARPSARPPALSAAERLSSLQVSGNGPVASPARWARSETSQSWRNSPQSTSPIAASALPQWGAVGSPASAAFATPTGTRPGSPELGATPGSNAVTQWRPTPTSTPTPAAGPMAPPSGWKAPARGMDGLHAGVPGGAPTLANGFRSYDGQLAGCRTPDAAGGFTPGGPRRDSAGWKTAASLNGALGRDSGGVATPGQASLSRSGSDHSGPGSMRKQDAVLNSFPLILTGTNTSELSGWNPASTSPGGGAKAPGNRWSNLSESGPGPASAGQRAPWPAQGPEWGGTLAVPSPGGAGTPPPELAAAAQHALARVQAGAGPARPSEASVSGGELGEGGAGAGARVSRGWRPGDATPPMRGSTEVRREKAWLAEIEDMQGQIMNITQAPWVGSLHASANRAVEELLQESGKKLRALCRLPESIARAALSKEDFEALLTWSMDLSVPELTAIGDWLSDPTTPVPLRALLCLPSSAFWKCATADDVRVAAQPLARLPGKLLQIGRKDAHFKQVLAWTSKSATAANVLQAVLNPLDVASGGLVLDTVAALPPAMLAKVHSPQELDFVVKWFNRAPESVAAVAKFIESNPTLSLPQVSRAPLAILSKCTKQEHVDWLFRSTKVVSSNREMLNIATVMLDQKVLDLDTFSLIPLSVLAEVRTVEQMHIVVRLAPLLGEMYVPLHKLSPEKTWRRPTQGEFGAIFQAEMAGAAVACKLPFKVDDWLDLTIQEILTLGKLPPHPAIVPLYGITLKLHRGDIDLFLLMEFCPQGNAARFLAPVNATNGTWVDRFAVLLSVAEGMAHMHNHNPPIVHRDLKPENVLLKERPKKVQDGGKWQGVITDFGLARLKQGEVLKTKVAGTDRYMAPECFLPQNEGGGVSEPADVFSFGMVCWAILTGKLPFEGTISDDSEKGWIEVFKLVVEEGKRPDEFSPWPKQVPPEVRELVRQCWAQKRQARPTFNDICHDLHQLTRHYRLCGPDAKEPRSSAPDKGGKRGGFLG